MIEFHEKKNLYLRLFKVDPPEENLRVRAVYSQSGYFVLEVRAFSTGINYGLG